MPAMPMGRLLSGVRVACAIEEAPNAKAGCSRVLSGWSFIRLVLFVKEGRWPGRTSQGPRAPGERLGGFVCHMVSRKGEEGQRTGWVLRFIYSCIQVMRYM